MTVLSVFACIVLAWALFAKRSGSVLLTGIERFAPRPSFVRAAFFVLAPLYALQLTLVATQSRFENVAPQNAWMKTLPVPVFTDRAYTHTLHPLFSWLGVGIGLLESIALAIIVLGLRRERALENRLVFALACVLGLLSLAAPVMETTDPYEYVASGILGFRSYAPAALSFRHTPYEVYENLIPMRRVIYGPLWLLVDIAETSSGSSIYDKIEAIRIANVGFVALFWFLLARAGVPRAALVACAVNPAVWYYAVANPHAEIVGLVLLSAAYLWARRSKMFFAAAFVCSAGLIKLPFVVLGGAMLSPLPDARRRCIGWLAAMAIVAVVSYAIPGPAYIANVSHFAADAGQISWSQDWLAIAPLVVAATAILLAVRRGHFGVAWLFHQMAPLAAPWYLYWGFPYALASGSFELYLVAFPFAATQAIGLDSISRGVLFAVVIVLTCDALRSRRHRAPAFSAREFTGERR